jgi:hypothetical protein
MEMLTEAFTNYSPTVLLGYFIKYLDQTNYSRCNTTLSLKAEWIFPLPTTSTYMIVPLFRQCFR